jgi:hypothetical protein
MTQTGDKFRVNPGVVAKRMADGAVLIDSATGDCFELNQVGTRVWESLQRGEDPLTIVDSLATEYSVETSVISSDIATLIQDLARHRILVASR